MKMVVHYIY